MPTFSRESHFPFERVAMLEQQLEAEANDGIVAASRRDIKKSIRSTQAHSKKLGRKKAFQGW